VESPMQGPRREARRTEPGSRGSEPGSRGWRRGGRRGRESRSRASAHPSSLHALDPSAGLLELPPQYAGTRLIAGEPVEREDEHDVVASTLDGLTESAEGRSVERRPGVAGVHVLSI